MRLAGQVVLGLGLMAGALVSAEGPSLEVPGFGDLEVPGFEEPGFAFLAQCENAVRTQPDAEANRISLATLYLRIGRNAKAIETLTDYFRSHTGSAAGLRLLAVADLRQEDYGAAKEAAQRAIVAGPNNAESFHLLGMSHLGLQDSEAAEANFRKSLQLEPELTDSNFQLGLVYARKHEHLQEAVALLEKARARQPEAAGIYTALGLAWLGMNKPDRAAQALETAVAKAPDSAESWYILADAYRGLNKGEKTDAALQRFRTLSSASAALRASEMRSRARYEEGLALLNGADDRASLDRAFALFSEAAKELATFDAAYYRMAQVSYLQGDAVRGLGYIRQAIRLNVAEPEYYFVEAKCLENRDRASALASVRKAIALRPGVADFEELLKDLDKK